MLSNAKLTSIVQLKLYIYKSMTKKLFILIALSLACIFPSFSQEVKKPVENRKYMFGLKTGVNLSWYKPDSKDLNNGGLKPGFSYGIMGDYNFQPNYAIAMEFLVSTVNGKVNFKDPLTFNDSVKATKVEYAYSVRYIQLPISFKFRTNQIGYIKYFAQFGLAPGIRVSAKANLTGSGLPWPEDDRTALKVNSDLDESFEPLEYNDDVHQINLPLIIGLGIEYNLSGNTDLYASLRFENGFTHVVKDKVNTVFSKNLAISAGVFF